MEFLIPYAHHNTNHTHIHQTGKQTHPTLPFIQTTMTGDGPSKGLSDARINHGIQITSQPLTGRQIMVPLNSKAFFVGKLTPNIDEESGKELVWMPRSMTTKEGPATVATTKGQSVADNEDLDVDMDVPSSSSSNNNNERLQEMKRIDACNVFKAKQRELRTRQQKPKSTSVAKAATKATKKTPLESSIASNPSSTASNVLPYFEIREELDEKGREVHSEAVNVMKQLEYLESKENEEIGKERPEVVGDGITYGSEMETGLAAQDDSADKTNHNGHDDSTGSDAGMSRDGSTEPTVPSDSDYEKISRRLDELALMEEQDSTNKKQNRKSAKTLQGSGWGRGFLNKTKPKKSTKITTKPTTATRNETKRDDRSRKVAFSVERNEVKEIPRIGTHHVPPTRRTKTAASTTVESDSFGGGSISSPTRPFSTDVFSGVVKERGFRNERKEPDAAMGGGRPKLSRFAQQRQQQQQQGSNETTDNGAVQQKPLSRFAMERQQRR